MVALRVGLEFGGKRSGGEEVEEDGGTGVGPQDGCPRTPPTHTPHKVRAHTSGWRFPSHTNTTTHHTIYARGGLIRVVVVSPLSFTHKPTHPHSYTT